MARAPLLERARGIGEKRLRQQEPRIDAHRRQLGRAARRKEIHLAESHVGEQLPRLILDDIRQGAHDQQIRTPRCGGCGGRLGTSEARQASSPCVKVVSMPLPE